MNLDWIEEKIPRVNRGNWIYNLVCFLLAKRKRKLSYKEYMMILFELNKNNLGEDKAKEKSIMKAIEVYKYNHNGMLPDMGDDENEQG